MKEGRAFVDTNILLYLMSEDSRKADRAEDVLRSGAMISVQVLNEITNVARRKLSLSWQEIIEFLSLVRDFCEVSPITIEIHDEGLRIAERYQISVYDAMIVAAALLGECSTLYSEDMQNGLLIDDQLQIMNPM